MIEQSDIERAREGLQGVIRALPAVSSATLSMLADRPVFVKPEHLQRTGSFKIRGAYSKVRSLADQGCQAVVAASAGNHGQGVALAASLCGLASTVFMPSDASLPKIEATRAYGAAVSLANDTIDECIVAARDFAGASGASYVPPFDDPLVVAGQGTIGLELAEETPTATTIVVPVGGGGLIAGIAAALVPGNPNIRVVGVEPSGAASMAAALQRGAPIALEHCDTMADGVAVREVSRLTLEHVQLLVSEMVTVEEEEISRAVLLLLERCKWVVEPAGALAVAALLAGKVTGSDAAVAVLSGGNVDPLLLTRLIEHGLSAAGRYLQVRVVLRDRPGVLARLATTLGDLQLNIVTVEHRRSGPRTQIGHVEVLLTLETRDPGHRDQVLRELAARGFTAELWE